MRSSFAPLVLTHPYVWHIREKFLKKLVDTPSNASAESSSASASADKSVSLNGTDRMKRLLQLQREVRSDALKRFMKSPVGSVGPKGLKTQFGIHPVETINADNYMQSDKYYLMSYKSFVRTKKQSLRDVKAFEKQDRRRKGEIDDRKRRRFHDFHKILMIRRDDYFRFHKGRKSGQADSTNLPNTTINFSRSKSEYL